MERVLLIDSDEDHARTLALFLERHRYAVTVSTSKGNAFRPLERNCEEFDVVILDMSANRPQDWRTFDQIRTLPRMTTVRPMILCLSRVYRGPGMKLEIERKGARLVYER